MVEFRFTWLCFALVSICYHFNIGILSMKVNLYDGCWDHFNGYCSEENEACSGTNITEVDNEQTFGQLCPDGYKCCVILKLDDKVKRKDKKCGLVNKTIDMEMGVEKWPWMTTIYFNGKPWCGATVINKQWLLTSASCFYENVYDSMDSWTVSIGADLRDLSDPTIISLPIKAYYIHPGYSYQPRSRNLALVKLESRLRYNETVQPACLPVRNELFQDSVCLQIGFGSQVTSVTNYDIHQISLPIINLNQCAKESCFYGNTVYNTSLCMGNTHTLGSTCDSDQGGPILCRKYNKKTMELQWVLAGVLDAQVDCTIEGAPNIHTTVEPFLDWINDAMSKGQSKLTEDMIGPVDTYSCDDYDDE